MSSQETFVLNPKYAAYVAGKEPFPVRKFGCSNPLFVAVLIAVILVASLIAYSLWHTYAEFCVTGVATQARVMELWVNTDGENTTYQLQVRFTAIDDHTYDISLRVDGSQYYRYSAGDAITIIYLPANPNVIRAVWDVVPVTAISYTLIALLSFLWLYLLLRKYRKQRRLAEFGAKLMGKIEGIHRKTDSEGGVSTSIRIKFQSPIGATRMLSCQSSRTDLKDWVPEKGTLIAIQYLDDRLFKVL